MAWTNGGRTHVPTAVRNAMLERDNNQCTATRQDGQRCPEITNLEAHEPRQAHLNGVVALADVVTLCHWHHNRETQAQAAAARQRRGNTALRPTEVHPAHRTRAKPQEPAPF